MARIADVKLSRDLSRRLQRAIKDALTATRLGQPVLRRSYRGASAIPQRTLERYLSPSEPLSIRVALKLIDRCGRAGVPIDERLEYSVVWESVDKEPAKWRTAVAPGEALRLAHRFAEIAGLRMGLTKKNAHALESRFAAILQRYERQAQQPPRDPGALQVVERFGSIRIRS